MRLFSSTRSGYDTFVSSLIVVSKHDDVLVQLNSMYLYQRTGGNRELMHNLADAHF
jgi:hypothetical protein